MEPLANAAQAMAPGMAATQMPTIPVEQFEEIREQTPPVLPPIIDFIREQCRKFREAVSPEYRRYYARNLRNQKYLFGEQFWDIDPETGQIYELTPEREWAHIDNQYEYFIEAMVANLLKSMPRLTVKCRSNEREHLSDIKEAQAWVSADRPFSDFDTLTESYLLILRGIVWYWTSPTLAGPEVERPTFVEIEGPTERGWYCLSCGMEEANESLPPTQGEGADPALAAPEACTRCGNPAIRKFGNDAAPIYTMGEPEKAPSVSIKTEIIDDMQMGWYIPAGTPDRSPVIWRDQMVLTEELIEIFPWLATSLGGSSARTQTTDLNLRFLDDAQRSAGNWHSDPFFVGSNALQAGATDLLRRRVTRYWAYPYVYRNWTNDSGMEIVFADGKVIPPGGRFSDYFPKGMCIWFVDDHVVHMESCDRRERLDFLMHKINPSGGLPRGSETLVALQDKLNALNIFQMVHLATESSGTLVINPKVITSATARKNLMRPGRFATADGWTPGIDLTRQAAFRVPSGSPSNESFIIPERAVGSMQGHSQVYATSPNADKAPINTATGVNEMAAQIAQMTEPRLRARAQTRADIATRRLNMARRYCADPVFCVTPGTHEAGRYVQPSRIEGDLYVVFDPDSHIVRTGEQKRADVVAFANVVAVFLKGGMPDMVRVAMKVFGIDELSDDGIDEWEALAFQRMARIKDIATEIEPMLEQAMQMVAGEMVLDPMSGAMLPAEQFVLQQNLQTVLELAKALPDPRDRHEVFIDVYTRYWITPEGQEDSDLVQQANLAVIQAHKAEIEMQMAEEAAKMAAQEEMVNGPAAEREQDAADADHEREEESKERDFERQERSKANDDARERRRDSDARRHDKAMASRKQK